MGCGENEGSTLRSALLVPRSYFPPLCSYEFRSSACPPFFFSPAPEFQGSLLSPAAAAAVSFFFFVWLAAAKRKDTKRKRAELARSPLIPFYISLLLVLIQFSRLSFSRSPPPPPSPPPLAPLALPRALAAARWFVNAKFKLSRATLLHEPLCDANEGTNTSTLSKSPREPSPRPYKRRNEHTNETRAGRKGEERRTAERRYIFP